MSLQTDELTPLQYTQQVFSMLGFCDRPKNPPAPKSIPDSANPNFELSLNKVHSRFPDVLVEVAKTTQKRKKELGPISFQESQAYDSRGEVALKVEGIYINCMLAGSIVGLGVGAGIGAGVGFGAAGPAGTVPGAAVGGLIGAGAGAGLGYCLAEEISIITIRETPAYRIWLETEINESKRQLLMNYCKTYFAAELICPLSRFFPAFPVFANNQIYEKEEIVNWLRQKKEEEESLIKRLKGCSKDQIHAAVLEHRKTVCPLRGDYFTEEDLTCNEKDMKKIIHFLQVNFEVLNKILDEIDKKAGSTTIGKLMNALMENKQMLEKQKIERAKSELEKYNISESYKEQIYAYLRQSDDNF